MTLTFLDLASKTKNLGMSNGVYDAWPPLLTSTDFIISDNCKVYTSQEQFEQLVDRTKRCGCSHIFDGIQTEARPRYHAVGLSANHFYKLCCRAWGISPSPDASVSS